MVNGAGQPVAARRVRAVATALLAGPTALDLIAADGFAIEVHGQHATIGAVPDRRTQDAIAAWARTTNEEIAATDSLSTRAPDVTVAPAAVSGVLAIALPDHQYLLWFRAEARHTRDWSGDPRTKVNPSTGQRQLGPRKSFYRWREIVHDRFIPWTTAQSTLASELRVNLLEALYTRTQRGLHLAETLQRSLLPETMPDIPGWSVTAHYETAEGGQVGGDWYDALVLHDGTLALVIGDVAGHGIAAAGIMAQLRNTLRAHLLDTASAAQTLTKLNDFTMTLLPHAFATALIACINPRTGHAQAASAGHLNPYLIRPAAPPQPVPIRTSPPLGTRHTTFADTAFTLQPRQGLVLYTDGLIERRTNTSTTGCNASPPHSSNPTPTQQPPTSSTPPPHPAPKTTRPSSSHTASPTQT